MDQPATPENRCRLITMHLFIVNPNATADMTDRIGMEARLYLPRHIRLSTATNTSGPPSIQGAEDGRLAEPGTLSLMLGNEFDAAIIGCFDDTALAEITEQKNCPVVGLGKAAFLKAHQAGRKFAVLTTSHLSVPVLVSNINAYALNRHCVEVRASAIEVLDFETSRESATAKLIQAAQALRVDHPEVETLVLGCAGMGGLATRMQDATGLRIIDPVKAAVEYAVSALEHRSQKTTIPT